MEKYTNEERFENQVQSLQDSSRDKQILTPGRVAGYYYNVHTKVAFKNPPAKENLEYESSLLNHRIQDYDQLLS